MATSYRGMYRLDESGNPSHVQVASPGGNSLPLPIDEYESRGVLPDWCELPTFEQHKALSAVADITQGSSAFINPAVAELCADRNWLEPVGIGGWRLTEAGKRFL